MAAASKKSNSSSPYSVHPGIPMVQKWIADLPQKSGRSLDEWIALARKSGPATEKECREWLKQNHGFGTNNASWIAARVHGTADGSDSDPDIYLRVAPKYVAEMFAGKKAALLPLYCQLLDLGLGVAEDVKACPGKTAVPLYRNHVFAQIKPATNARIDLGFALGNRKVPKRLIDTGGFAKKDRITHRIEITKAADVDDEVKRWLNTAYELDA